MNSNGGLMKAKFGSAEHQEEFKDHAAKWAMDITRDAAMLIFKSLILVNGGALAGVLTYIATTKAAPGTQMPGAAVTFAVGLLMAMISLALFYYHSKWQSQSLLGQMRGGQPIKLTLRRKLVACAIDALAWLSMLVFACGLCKGGLALLGA